MCVCVCVCVCVCGCCSSSGCRASGCCCSSSCGSSCTCGGCSCSCCCSSSCGSGCSSGCGSSCCGSSCTCGSCSSGCCTSGASGCGSCSCGSGCSSGCGDSCGRDCGHREGGSCGDVEGGLLLRNGNGDGLGALQEGGAGCAQAGHVIGAAFSDGVRYDCRQHGGTAGQQWSIGYLRRDRSHLNREIGTGDIGTSWGCRTTGSKGFIDLLGDGCGGCLVFHTLGDCCRHLVRAV